MAPSPKSLAVGFGPEGIDELVVRPTTVAVGSKIASRFTSVVSAPHKDLSEILTFKPSFSVAASMTRSQWQVFHCMAGVLRLETITSAGPSVPNARSSAARAYIGAQVHLTEVMLIIAGNDDCLA